jgi:hypothetical protein
MRQPGAVFAVAIAVGVTVGCALVWELGPLHPGFVEHVILPAGTVLRDPGFTAVGFDVPPAGGVLVGAASVDHTSLDFRWWPVGEGTTSCGTSPVNVTYFGPAWSYSVHERLAPGEYLWGVFCYHFGNATFTQPLEIVTP